MNKESSVVTIYSFKDCDYCNNLKKQLEEAGIDFIVKDLDLTENVLAVEKISNNYLDGNTELPIVVKEGKYFSRPKIEDL